MLCHKFSATGVFRYSHTNINNHSYDVYSLNLNNSAQLENNVFIVTYALFFKRREYLGHLSIVGRLILKVKYDVKM
jgi:hypothetical protein